LKLLIKKLFNRFLFSLGLAFVSLVSYSQHRAVKSNQVGNDFFAYPINIGDELEIFNNRDRNAVYRISLCADVPNNNKPWRVALQHQTGHVFLILQKINSADTISEVFGFYPKKGLPTLFFKKIKSKIKDNSKRAYDVEIAKEVSAEEFDSILTKSILYAQRVYHINKFNCYDYALEIFNSVARQDPLPSTHVRFPFIFGKGGSPCSVYRDLKKLKESDAFWAPFIRFGDLVAPISTARIRQNDK